MREFTVGEKVTFFHSFFMRNFPATVTRVTKTRVTIEFEPTIYVNSPKGKRSMTLKQASDTLA